MQSIPWSGGLIATYRAGMDQRAHEDIAATAAAHRELGPGFEDGLAEGLIERIGAEIDRRVDARLGERGYSAPTPSSARPPSVHAANRGTRRPRPGFDGHRCPWHRGCHEVRVERQPRAGRTDLGRHRYRQRGLRPPPLSWAALLERGGFRTLPREGGRATFRIALEVVLVFGLGRPEGAGLGDLGHDLARPVARGVDVTDRRLGDLALLLARAEDRRAVTGADEMFAKVGSVELEEERQRADADALTWTPGIQTRAMRNGSALSGSGADVFFA